jgi:hypothetical protein
VATLCRLPRSSLLVSFLVSASNSSSRGPHQAARLLPGNVAGPLTAGPIALYQTRAAGLGLAGSVNVTNIITGGVGTDPQSNHPQNFVLITTVPTPIVLPVA